MAKLPALISALDLTSDRDHSTIEHLARIVREAGLIPTTKRGPGAAEMGVREAANLLLAVALPDVPKAAPRAIGALRSFIRQDKNHPDEYVPSVFSEIHEAGDFGTALEALIACAANIAVYGREYVIKKNDPSGLDFIKISPEIVALDEIYNIRVHIYSYPLRATITAPCFHNGHFYQHTWRYVEDRERVMDRDPFQYGRINTRVEIGLVPIFKLWAALNGMPHANGPTELSL